MPEIVKLGQIVEGTTGTRNPTKAPDNNFIYVDVAAVDNAEKRIVGARSILGSEAPSRARKVIRTNDILVSTVRPNLNAVALVPADLDDQVASTGFCVLRASAKVLPEYLFFFVRSRKFVDGLSSLVAGAMYPAVSDSQVLDQSLPLPPLPEQHRIADLLSRAEGIVRLRREAEKKAAELIPALFLDMFGDPATNPRGWARKSIAETGASIRYGIGQPLPQKADGLPFLRATNVKRGKISRTGLVFIDPDANPKKRNPPLDRSDIIVVRSGAYTGDVAQVGAEYEGAIAGYDLVLHPSPNHLSEFVANYLLLPYVQVNLIGGHKIRAAQPHLNATQLGGIVIPIPPLGLQQKFADSIDQIASIQFQQAAAIVKAQATFDALLAQTFSR